MAGAGFLEKEKPFAFRSAARLAGQIVVTPAPTTRAAQQEPRFD